MDPLHAHQFWGLSPAVDLLSCTPDLHGGDGSSSSSSSGSSAAPQLHQPTSILQVCPYDCRHTLTTIASVLRQHAGEGGGASDDAGPAAAPLLELWVYEPETQLLARHMLLLALLFDGSQSPRERAEAFLELHGNALLRQRTADWLRTASVWLEAFVAGEPAAAPCPRAASSLAVFDLTGLRFRERDELLETFQQYRPQAAFDMAAAWDARCRKWYGDRYDARHNLIDWDYHMQLAPRGTPFLDPAVGSIIHFFHFRHWRLAGVAHELRHSSYPAANTTMLTTAHAHTHEYKDRNLRNVGRSVAARGFWGDVLSPPHHAFGTVADDPALFRLVNKQFSHTAADVAEHNTLGLIAALCGTATPTARSTGHSTSSTSSSDTIEAHRANAASGPTSMQHLAGDGKEAPSSADDQQAGDDSCSASSTTTSADAAASDSKQECSGPPPPPAAEQQHAAQLAADALRRLTSRVRIRLVTGDLKRCLAAAARRGGASSSGFACASIGHRHTHLLGAEHGLVSAMAPGARVLLETAHNMLQLSAKQVAAFEEAALQLARGGGFEAAPAAAAAGTWQPPPAHLMLAVVAGGGGDDGHNTAG